ncbi:hypothetical protein OKW21_000255 [Catalinimonas alkaloidigena]|uniref:sacsin N-terminal ATP-binding-like domain-containing protein n=1 Tax=Catalinimonas alkaloidigena TaxID=1075417 RepID=UPI002406661C|nr:hypothetical protein [Catalinimonas alkaloidigena]MDF9794992.1 hypothetical protein [Catalinimonas alkaloidigena]
MSIQDEIREAREQNRLNIPAKRLMEKLRPIPSNVNDLQHRWFWELLQNASDYNDSVDVGLEVYEDRLIFMHNGNPFRPSDAENLIAPDSGKDSDELREQDMIGQFGTGFISTHVVSPIVKVEGVMKSERETDQYLKFHFTLNRTAYDDKEALKISIPKTSKELDESIKPITYQPGEFYTKFTYDLNTSLPNIDSKEVVKEGLKYIADVLPYTLAFMPKIKSVTIHNSNTDRIAYTNRIFKPQSSDDSKSVIVNVFEFEHLFDSILLRLFNKNDAQLVIRVENNRIIPYPNGITKLFCSLPMIGTEAFSFPLVLNSKKFVPHLERDGISLTVNDTENRTILEDAVIAHSQALETLSEERIENWSCLVKWPTASFKTEQERAWYKTEVIDKIKATYLATKIVKTTDDWIKLDDTIIPYAPQDAYSEEDLLNYYDLVCPLRSESLPKNADYLNWNRNLDFSIFPGLRYSLEDFVKELSELGSLEQIIAAETTNYSWFNMVLNFVLQKDPDLLDKYAIIPNRLGNFVRRKDSIYWNNDVDSSLFEVYRLMTKEDFEEILVHPEINIANLLEGKREKTTRDLAKAIDDSFSEYQGNKQAPNFLKALRLTFQWARESDLPEKELKEHFKWFASHRPQLFLETFNENDRDKAFSIVQSGKLASLSKLAESSLTNEDINSMVAIGNSGVNINKMSELANLSKTAGIDEVLESARDLAREEEERVFKQEIGENVEQILNNVFKRELPSYEASLDRKRDYDILIRNKLHPLNQYFIELKSIKENNTEPIKMGIHQARKAKDNPNNYALLLIRRPPENSITEEYLRNNIICNYQIGKDVISEVDKSRVVDEIVKSMDSIKLKIKDPSMKVHIRQEYIDPLGKDFEELKTKIHEAIK